MSIIWYHKAHCPLNTVDFDGLNIIKNKRRSSKPRGTCYRLCVLIVDSNVVRCVILNEVLDVFEKVREEDCKHIVRPGVKEMSTASRVEEVAYLKTKSPFCAFFFGASILFFSTAVIGPAVRVPAAFSLVYNDWPRRAARSKIFLSTVSSA